mmetsp:Transcript_6892/g.28178  ORF Transcript_6892/g.28178 Transcript_6892/m.28178 type:complete len:261 (+) Transcript_6892:236-1018(+)
MPTRPPWRGPRGKRANRPTSQRLQTEQPPGPPHLLLRCLLRQLTGSPPTPDRGAAHEPQPARPRTGFPQQRKLARRGPGRHPRASRAGGQFPEQPAPHSIPSRPMSPAKRLQLARGREASRSQRPHGRQIRLHRQRSRAAGPMLRSRWLHGTEPARASRSPTPQPGWRMPLPPGQPALLRPRGRARPCRWRPSRQAARQREQRPRPRCPRSWPLRVDPKRPATSERETRQRLPRPRRRRHSSQRPGRGRPMSRPERVRLA